MINTAPLMDNTTAIIIKSKATVTHYLR